MLWGFIGHFSASSVTIETMPVLFKGAIELSPNKFRRWSRVITTHNLAEKITLCAESEKSDLVAYLIQYAPDQLRTNSLPPRLPRTVVPLTTMVSEVPT